LSFDCSPGPVQYGALAYPLIDEGCETCHLWLPLRSRAREPSCSDPSPFFIYNQLLSCFSTTFQSDPADLSPDVRNFYHRTLLHARSDIQSWLTTLRSDTRISQPPTARQPLSCQAMWGLEHLLPHSPGAR
jgi:hypothetical protein